MDLNNPNERYFDMDMIETSLTRGVYQLANMVSLEPCTVDHFSMTEKIKSNYDIMGLSQRLCSFEFIIWPFWKTNDERNKFSGYKDKEMQQ